MQLLCMQPRKGLHLLVCIQACSKSVPHLELVTLLQDLVNIGDALVANLADVQQASHTTQVNKCTIGLHGLHNTLDNIANLHAHSQKSNPVVIANSTITCCSDAATQLCVAAVLHHNKAGKLTL
jgi:hypothetical protein